MRQGEYILWQHKQGIEFFMVDSGVCVVEAHGAVVHRPVDGGSFGKRALINAEPLAASTRVTSKTLVCVCMKQIMTERIKLLQQVKLFWSFNRQELTEATQTLYCFTRGTTW